MLMAARLPHQGKNRLYCTFSAQNFCEPLVQKLFTPQLIGQQGRTTDDHVEAQ